MNRSINARQIIAYSPLFLLVFLVLTVFASPVSAQVFGSGPSDSALFDTVINVPPAPDIGQGETIGGDGLTTQLNVSDGGSIGSLFDANSGSEINISGGSIGTGFSAGSGSEVNISGGSFDDSFSSAFVATSGSEVNLVGTAFVLDGVVLSDSLSVEDAFTIVDRDVTLSGRLGDGTAFSFDLTSSPPVFEPDGDYFDPDATLTVRLNRVITRGDSGDGIATFDDIPWFIGVLFSGEYVAEADVNQDGAVDFADIPAFIELLIGS